jgi:hypothetical protein
MSKKKSYRPFGKNTFFYPNQPVVARSRGCVTRRPGPATSRWTPLMT